MWVESPQSAWARCFNVLVSKEFLDLDLMAIFCRVRIMCDRERNSTDNIVPNCLLTKSQNGLPWK